MDLQTLINTLDKLTDQASAAELLSVMDAAAWRRSDLDLQSYLRARLKGSGPQDGLIATVLTAAMFGAIPADLYQPAFTGKLHPFFHRLRKAMLECAELRDRMQDKAARYNFYPEFAAAFPNIRERIAAIAKAHAGLDKGSEELVVLFSLCGYFGYKDTETQMISALQSAGTTCVMTARGVYAAAGARMYTEQLPPKVNTSSGPQMDLGVPTRRLQDNGRIKNENTLQRADQEEYGLRGYDNDKRTDKPALQTGDIYYVDGDGKHRQLLRPGLAFAAHVGIVVARREVSAEQTKLDTVDGGSGLGGRIDLNTDRALTFVAGVGWTMSKAGVSFTAQGVSEAEVIIGGLSTTAEVVNYMRIQDPKFYSLFLKQYETMMQNRAKVAGDAAKTAIIDKDIARRKTDGHRLIREKFKSGASAQVRTIQGWWRPEQFSQTDVVSRATILGWLDQIPAFLTNPRVLQRELRI